MVILITIISLLLLIIVWLRIDYVRGMRIQKKSGKKHTQKTRYCNLHLLPTGDKLFKSMFQDIQDAQKHIHIQFYIVKDDHIGKKMQKLLKEKVAQGVTIRLLVDRIGCHLNRSAIKELKKYGIQFSYSHLPKFPYFFFTLNRRNHRKITVIDGKVGYLGGYNVGDEYLGRDPKFGNWRDFHLRLEGDGVQDLQRQFIQDWNASSKEQLTSDIYYPELRKGSSAIRILPTNGVFLEDTFLEFVRQANEKLYIATPYFIPGKELQSELLAAAKRGVDINIVVPKKPDHPLVKEASFPYFKKLLESDVNIYQYYRGFYHGKVVIIDNQLCDIGTANFDKRSFHLDHEINCLIYNKSFVSHVLEEIEYDISISDRLTLQNYENRSLFHKGKEKFATMVSGLL